MIDSDDAILLEFKNYMDSYGLVHPEPNTISHNGIRFTVEYAAACARLGLLSTDVKNQIFLSIQACEKLPGLYQRHPIEHQRSQEGPDDYVAIGLLAKLLGASFIAERLINYGKQNGFVFNNIHPGKFTLSSWLGRQPQLIAHWYFAAGKKAPLFHRMVWVATILMASRAKREDQDAWILSWMLVKASVDSSSFTVNVARRAWIKSFKKAWPGGVGEVLGDYFNNKDHPSAKYLIGEFGD